MSDCYLGIPLCIHCPYSSRSYRDVLSSKREHQTDHRIQSKIPLRMPGIYAGAGSKNHLLLTMSQPGKRQLAMSCLTVSVSDQHRQFGEIFNNPGFHGVSISTMGTLVTKRLCKYCP